MQIETNKGIELYGFYRGKVLQHCNYGKCKIFIPGIYPDYMQENKYADYLPEAEQASPLFGGCNKGNGMFSYPRIGSFVWCFFSGGSPDHPIYFASSLGGSIACADDKSGQWNQIRDYVHQDKDVQKDTTYTGLDAQKHIIRCGHSTIQINDSGTIKIYSSHTPMDPDTGEHKKIDGKDDSVREKDMSVITIDDTGKITIESDREVNIESRKITLNAKDKLSLNGAKIEVHSSSDTIMESENNTLIKTGKDIMQQAHNITLDTKLMSQSNKVGIVRAIGKRHNIKVLAD